MSDYWNDPHDRDIHGNRMDRDIHGNTPTDIWGRDWKTGQWENNSSSSNNSWHSGGGSSSGGGSGLGSGFSMSPFGGGGGLPGMNLVSGMVGQLIWPIAYLMTLIWVLTWLGPIVAGGTLLAMTCLSIYQYLRSIWRYYFQSPNYSANSLGPRWLVKLSGASGPISSSPRGENPFRVYFERQIWWDTFIVAVEGWGALRTIIYWPFQQLRRFQAHKLLLPLKYLSYFLVGIGVVGCGIVFSILLAAHFFASALLCVIARACQATVPSWCARAGDVPDAFNLWKKASGFAVVAAWLSLPCYLYLSVLRYW
jgi:hypothetical protein